MGPPFCPHAHSILSRLTSLACSVHGTGPSWAPLGTGEGSGQLWDPRAFPGPKPLLEAMPRPQSPQVRRLAQHANAGIGDKGGVEAWDSVRWEKEAQCPDFHGQSNESLKGVASNVRVSSRFPFRFPFPEPRCLSSHGLACPPALCTEAVDYVSQAPLHVGFLLGSANGRHSQSTGGREERLVLPPPPLPARCVVTGSVLPLKVTRARRPLPCSSWSASDARSYPGVKDAQ